MPKRGGFRKKRRTHVEQEEDPNVPRCLVVPRGKVSHRVKTLIHNLRIMLSPNCALNLKDSSKTDVLSYVSAAKCLNISHIMLLRQKDVLKPHIKLSMTRLPQGPTFTFKVIAFETLEDLQKVNSRQFVTADKLDMMSSPLVVLNGFKETIKNTKTLLKKNPQLNKNVFPAELLSVFFAKIFPSIDTKKIKLSQCRRVVLIHICPESKAINIRHYRINKKLPNSSNVDAKTLHNFTLQLLKAANASQRNHKKPRQPLNDNHAEGHNNQSYDDDDGSHDSLSEHEFNSQDDESELQRRSTKKLNEDQKESSHHQEHSMTHQSDSNSISISLIEIGPRLTLELTRVQDQTFEGEDLYHKVVKSNNCTSC